MKGVCITADGITFHRTIVSGQGPYVLPQLIRQLMSKFTIKYISGFANKSVTDVLR